LIQFDFSFPLAAIGQSGRFPKKKEPPMKKVSKNEAKGEGKVALVRGLAGMVPVPWSLRAAAMVDRTPPRCTLRSPAGLLAGRGEKRMATAAHDTIPCSAPESGEYAAVQIEVSPSEEPQAPRYIESVVGELRGILAGLRCAAHGTAPALTVDFGHDEDATVIVVPHDCCPQLDDLVADALRGSPIFRLIRPA
jgi:hypothetical protein